MCLKFAEYVTDCLDPDQRLRSAVSDLGLFCLSGTVCPDSQSEYDNKIKLSCFKLKRQLQSDLRT